MATRNRLGQFSANADSNGHADEWLKREFAANVLLSRSQLIQKFMDPRRDIEAECGYPPLNGIERQHYQNMYDREGVGKRVVEVLPRESWQVTPWIYDVEDADTASPFEQAWDEVGSMLRGDSSFKQEKGNPIWEYLKRVDEQAGIGRFGILLIGLDDGKSLSSPAGGINPKTGKRTTLNRTGITRRITFLRAFPESLVQISACEQDVSSPRYGLPVKYTVTFADPTTTNAVTVDSVGMTVDVHWTRVIHVADLLGSSDLLGQPRMQAVYNYLCGLVKLYHGSAEMYWRGAFPGLSIETHPQLGGDVQIDEQKHKDMMFDYMNGLQRYLNLFGMTAKSMAPQVVDPTPQIDAMIGAICITIGCPKRVFMGSERGELASSQDDAAWNDRLKERQNGYITPRIIIPFVDRLISIGVLPEPQDGFCIEWPDLSSLTDTERADIALKRTQGMAQYVSGSVESIMLPFDYLTRVIGFTEEEANAIIDNKLAQIEEEDTSDSPLFGLVGGVTAWTEMFKAAQAGGMTEDQLKFSLKLFYQLTDKQVDDLLAEGLPEPPAPVLPPGAGLPPKGLPGKPAPKGLPAPAVAKKAPPKPLANKKKKA